MTKTELTNYNERFKWLSTSKGLDYVFALIPQSVKLKISICLDREKGYSYQRLVNIHGKSKSTIKRYCEECGSILNQKVA